MNVRSALPQGAVMFERLEIALWSTVRVALVVDAVLLGVCSIGALVLHGINGLLGSVLVGALFFSLPIFLVICGASAIPMATLATIVYERLRGQGRRSIARFCYTGVGLGVAMYCSLLCLLIAIARPTSSGDVGVVTLGLGALLLLPVSLLCAAHFARETRARDATRGDVW
jgi:hypothetical protein